MGLAENEFLKYLTKFNKYCFEVVLDKKAHIIGDGDPVFKVIFNRLPDIESLLESTTIALGELYISGDLQIDGDLYSVLNCFLNQLDKISLDRKVLKKILRQSKSKRALVKNITSYYKLSVHFYELLLGETMCFSTAYFKDKEDGLDKAQYNNMKVIFQKLKLKDGMTICDIGGSWGTLIIEAAKTYNIQGFLAVLSREQESEIREKIRLEGLEKQLEVKKIDYHELSRLGKKFDCIVSIDMLEYINYDSYYEYFNAVKSVMNEESIFLLQSVNTIKDKLATPWINKYIKPGTQIPVLWEIIKSASDSGFKLIGLENVSNHSAATYKYWNKNIHNNIDELEEMYDNKFIRGWELYLNGYRAAFNTGIVDSHQILFSNCGVFF